MDLATLRTEIKSWERGFKSQNAREPSVQDIKNNPSVAEKYKLYKKLVKSAVEPTRLVKPQTASTSSNPARPHPKIVLIPKELPVPSPTQPSVINPFSPSRKADKNEITLRSTHDVASLPSNPFSTPRKRRAASSLHETSPSQSPTGVSKVSDHSLNHTMSQSGLGTVARARKRLRGEPVSPSPQKRTTRRRVSLQANDPLNPCSSDSEYSNGHERGFVDDSPIKPIANGKHFKSLFDEKSGHLSKPLFNAPVNPLDQLFFSPVMNSDPTCKPRTIPKAFLNPVVDGTSPSETDDCLAYAERQSQNAHDREGNGRQVVVSPRKKLKRPVSPDLSVWKSHSTGLLPPSPTQNAPKSTIAKGKAPERKKLRLGAEQADLADSSGDTDEDVREVSWNFHTGKKTAQWKHFLSGDEIHDQPSPTIHDKSFPESIPRFLSNNVVHSEDTSTVDVGTLEVDLPYHLKSVLSISPSKKYPPDDALVRNLLYGEYIQGYGGPQGGEVWGVGEVESAHTDSEDDWAGEGIPWETAEL